MRVSDSCRVRVMLPCFCVLTAGSDGTMLQRRQDSWGMLSCRCLRQGRRNGCRHRKAPSSQVSCCREVFRAFLRDLSLCSSRSPTPSRPPHRQARMFPRRFGDFRHLGLPCLRLCSSTNSLQPRIPSRSIFIALGHLEVPRLACTLR